jgi:CubicO group peptidase (beta-lactamase class C family)
MRMPLLLVLAFIAVGPTTVSAQTTDRMRIAQATDSIVAAALKDGRAAGMSVAVVRGPDTLVMKAYGFADLEFDVPTPDRAIYEIGSITKQFTAAAILLLHEQNKLSLDDELTKYLPDYPTQGHRITLRRLLDHTSGIKGYTELPEFGRLMMMKFPRDTLVALFSGKPFDFAPGEGQVYNNSAYFLLGLVIEKASGSTYAEFVQKQLFEHAGMVDSRYCSESAVVKRRAHGYDTGPGGLRRAAYLDHTWPYAAGSLCSTVGDLVAWNQALHGGRILSPASYRELITPGPLNDGTLVRYAKGLAVDSMLGQRIIQHGGGINGFLSDLKYFPDDTLSIAVLINTAGPVAPGAITQRIAEVIYGKWTRSGVAFTGNLSEYAGEYRGVGRGQPLTVRIEADSSGKALMLRRGNAAPTPLLYLGNEVFDLNGARYTFLRENGRITQMRADFGSLNSILKRN